MFEFPVTWNLDCNQEDAKNGGSKKGSFRDVLKIEDSVWLSWEVLKMNWLVEFC